MSEKKQVSAFKRKTLETQKLTLKPDVETPVFQIVQPIEYVSNGKGGLMPKTTVVIAEESLNYPEYQLGAKLVFLPTSVVVGKINDLFGTGEYVGEHFTLTQPSKKTGKFYDTVVCHCELE